MTEKEHKLGDATGLPAGVVELAELISLRLLTKNGDAEDTSSEKIICNISIVCPASIHSKGCPKLVQ